MDKWDWDRGYRNKGGAAAATSPSFSSSLLDAIYRSIDEGDGCSRPPVVQADDPPTKTHQVAYRQHLSGAHTDYLHDDVGLGMSLGRAGYGQHQPPPTTQQQQQPKQRWNRGERGRRSSVCSASSSSESSSAGGFSSSEAESVPALSVRTKPPLAAAAPAGVADRSVRQQSDRAPPAAVKAEAAARKAKQHHLQHHQAQKLHQGQQQHPHKDGAGTISGRIRASRIYGELKKARSPVSPGGRLAAFLNTLFTNANMRGGSKSSKSTSTSPRVSALQLQQCHAPPPLNPPQRRPAALGAGSTEDEYSVCSSASSYSRSCLSKTPSTQGGGAKRSVRFCPVNVIVDDVGVGVDNGSRRFREKKKPGHDAVVHPYAPAARRLPAVELVGDVEIYDDEDDYDDGTASCSSSDLFELENLTGVGGSRYADELPVYETTHLGTNRAIAQGLVV